MCTEYPPHDESKAIFRTRQPAVRVQVRPSDLGARRTALAQRPRVPTAASQGTHHRPYACIPHPDFLVFPFSELGHHCLSLPDRPAEEMMAMVKLEFEFLLTPYSFLYRLPPPPPLHHAYQVIFGASGALPAA